MKLSKYSIGMGDRFAHQGKAQLQAVQTAFHEGVFITPVWNKSNREHTFIKSRPEDVRKEADAAVAALGWAGEYRVDADHIGLKTVDAFLGSSDFFTLDVADFTGKAASENDIEAFVSSQSELLGTLEIPGIPSTLSITKEDVRDIAGKFLLAIQEAGKIYRHIESAKGKDQFITEVSIDETDSPQTPVELLFILAMIAQEGIPAQTVAPKFTGRFNKGVDYVGDLAQFAKEFDEDLCVIEYAVKKFGLPDTLKLSVHSGSDKFSIYPIMREAVQRKGTGLHVKTAGTTWLEELIGLAEAGGSGLEIAKDIYAESHAHYADLAAPYATVIDIDPEKLPAPDEVSGWNSAQYVAALRHVPSCPEYNRHLRQLLHVGFKIAAGMGDRYTSALKEHEEIIARNVTSNLLERHIRPIFA